MSSEAIKPSFFRRASVDLKSLLSTSLPISSLFLNSLLSHSVFKDAPPLRKALIQPPSFTLRFTVCIIGPITASSRSVQAEHVLWGETDARRLELKPFLYENINYVTTFIV